MYFLYLNKFHTAYTTLNEGAAGRSKGTNRAAVSGSA